MPQPVNSIAATLRFANSAAPKFYDLASPICWCLRQAEIHIRDQDMGFSGDSMSFVTDHGTISVNRKQSKADSVEIAIEVSADSSEDVTVARQICYQLIHRLCHRAKITSIVWQPSRQVLRPAQFTWAVLQDMPRRLGEVTQIRQRPHYGAAIH
ncbi:hypothetical protein ILP92_12430 [Maribius pontilimi]|uniref:Uncharacterized protein n=1 Tax=Palleronia pontilimi TaxID=1964209 RepID=A0A934IAL1_9RHOB|nr:hypothetical protein [Palleronia pontilimi]MBJ3763554.1 hypothetical protein [Palleronia pontilimi]